MSSRPYVGIKGTKREVFSAANPPTEASHGDRYTTVIGPFRSKAGAQFMAEFGQGNPHCQTVAEAEKLARKQRETGSASLISRVTGRYCFHVLQSVVAPNREYRALIVEENRPGYSLTDWTWGTDFRVAEGIAAKRNARLGLSPEQCEAIVDSSIAAQMRQEGAARKAQQGPPSPCGKYCRGHKVEKSPRRPRLTR